MKGYLIKCKYCPLKQWREQKAKDTVCFECSIKHLAPEDKRHARKYRDSKIKAFIAKEMNKPRYNYKLR